MSGVSASNHPSSLAIKLFTPRETSVLKQRVLDLSSITHCPQREREREKRLGQKFVIGALYQWLAEVCCNPNWVSWLCRTVCVCVCESANL